MIEEDEGPDHLVGERGQQALHLESAEIPGVRLEGGSDQRRHAEGSGTGDYGIAMRIDAVRGNLEGAWPASGLLGGSAKAAAAKPPQREAAGVDGVDERSLQRQGLAVETAREQLGGEQCPDQAA